MKTLLKAKATEYLEVFQQVTRLISNVHDPQRVMDLVVERLPSLLDVDAATIRLLDPATNTFILGSAHGVSLEYLSRSTIDTEEVMSSLMEGKPTARADIKSACEDDVCKVITKEGVRSIMSLPIIHKEHIIGLLRLLTRDTRVFTDSELRFAMSLAEQVGVAITNGRMFQELEDQLRFFEAQREISKMVHSTLDLDTILETIVDKLPELFNVTGCTIRLLHPATNRLELVAASGLTDEYLNRGSIRREDTIFKALTGEPVAIYDAENDPRVDYHDAIKEEGIKSLLAIPIPNNREVIGVVRLLSRSPRTFSRSEIHFALMVAEEGGNAIEKARTYRKITLLFNQIEEHERLLQTILDAMWMQLVVFDSNKRVILVNKQFLINHSLLEEELIGKHISEIASHVEEANAAPMDSILAGEKSITLRKEKNENGKSAWFEHHYAPITDADDDVQFIIEAIRDITDQVELEEEKMERVKLEGVIEMAGTAAHELNTPLFAALGMAELLEDDLETSFSEEMGIIIRNMQEMKKQIRKMTSVTGFESRDYVGNTKIIQLKNEE